MPSRYKYKFADTSLGHPYKDRVNNGSIYEHIKIVEKAIGKSLDKRHQVHHRDGNGWNNKNNNLIICEDQNYHRLLEKREKAYRATGDAHKRQCTYCKVWDNPSNMILRGGGESFRHRACHNIVEKKLKLNRRK